MKASSGQKSSSGIRNIMPGASDIASLAKPIGANVGIYEQEASTYNLMDELEENKVFNLNESVRSLLEGLEVKNMQEETEQSNED